MSAHRCIACLGRRSFTTTGGGSIPCPYCQRRSPIDARLVRLAPAIASSPHLESENSVLRRQIQTLKRKAWRLEERLMKVRKEKNRIVAEADRHGISI